MGEPFVDGPICPNVHQMFSKELFGALEGPDDAQAGSGTSKPGSHFKEGFFGIWTRRRDLVKVFRRVPEADVQRLKVRYFGIGWRVVEGLHKGLSGPECRLELAKGVHRFGAEESWNCSSELGHDWEVSKCRVRLRTKGAGDTLEAG